MINILLYMTLINNWYCKLSHFIPYTAHTCIHTMFMEDYISGGKRISKFTSLLLYVQLLRSIDAFYIVAYYLCVYFWIKNKFCGLYDFLEMFCISNPILSLSLSQRIVCLPMVNMSDRKKRISNYSLSFMKWSNAVEVIKFNKVQRVFFF